MVGVQHIVLRMWAQGSGLRCRLGLGFRAWYLRFAAQGF